MANNDKRPGVVEFAVPLWNSDDLSLWNTALEGYKEAIKVKAGKKPPKKPETTTKGLVELDTWLDSWQPSLTAGVSKAELINVVNWKLKREKFMPLMKLVEGNSDEAIRAATKESFVLATGPSPNADRRKAIDALAKPLTGVGPATASAILARVTPASFPYMSDEAMDTVPELEGVKRAYTTSRYEKFAAALVERAESLSSSSFIWTAVMVKKALWATVKLGIEQKSSGEKRKRDE